VVIARAARVGACITRDFQGDVFLATVPGVTR